MISKTNSSVIRASYPSKASEVKQTKDSLKVSQQNDTNKVKQLKESINSGEYKVNVEALSKKIADSLL